LPDNKSPRFLYLLAVTVKLEIPVWGLYHTWA